MRCLDENQAIGLAVREAGWRVELSPVVVSNVVIRRSVRRALERQARWNKIRYAFSKATYGGELLLNPFGVAFLAALASAPLAPLAPAPRKRPRPRECGAGSAGDLHTSTSRGLHAWEHR